MRLVLLPRAALLPGGCHVCASSQLNGAQFCPLTQKDSLMQTVRSQLQPASRPALLGGALRFLRASEKLRSRRPRLSGTAQGTRDSLSTFCCSRRAARSKIKVSFQWFEVVRGGGHVGRPSVCFRHLLLPSSSSKFASTGGRWEQEGTSGFIRCFGLLIML